MLIKNLCEAGGFHQFIVTASYNSLKFIVLQQSNISYYVYDKSLVIWKIITEH